MKYFSFLIKLPVMLLMITLGATNVKGQTLLQVNKNFTGDSTNVNIGRFQVSSSNPAAPAPIDGILPPRVDTFPSTNPNARARGLMVYLQRDNMGTVNNTKGLYYWDGAAWQRVVGGNSAWLTKGNIGTNSSINKLGTLDTAKLSIVQNNITRVAVDANSVSILPAKVTGFNPSPSIQTTPILQIGDYTPVRETGQVQTVASFNSYNLFRGNGTGSAINFGTENYNSSKLEWYTDDANGSTSRMQIRTTNSGFGPINDRGVGFWENGTVTVGFASVASYGNLVASNIFGSYGLAVEGRVGVGRINPRVSLDVVGADGIIIPNGTTAQRPPGAEFGTIRYNSTIGRGEMYVNDVNGDGMLGDAGWRPI